MKTLDNTASAGLWDCLTGIEPTVELLRASSKVNTLSKLINSKGERIEKIFFSDYVQEYLAN